MLGSTVTAQEYGNLTLEEMFARTDSTVEAAKADNIEMLAPRSMRKAIDGYSEASIERARQTDERLIRIKLISVLDAVKAARETFRSSSKLLNAALIARQAVLESGADTTAANSWQSAEDRLLSAARSIEQGKQESEDQSSEDIAGAYWAVRREGLRNEILSAAQNLIQNAEQQNANRTTPTLMARAQQAMSRAETAVAQDSLDEARIQAKQAEDLARQAIGMTKYIESVSMERAPWEAALLPYDDLLLLISTKLGGTVNFSPGGAKTNSQFERLIEEHDRAYACAVDSLQSALAQCQTTHEAFVTESQTSSADAQNKIAELEKRLEDLEGTRIKAQGDLDQKQEIARRITIAQGMFSPSEAVIVQNELGSVIIRVIGIKFSSGKSSLTASQIALIGKVAKAIKEFPDANITVEGHTDSEGSESNNQEISEQRANAVAMELAQKLEVSASTLTVAGYGESQPISTNKTKAGRAENRRIDVLLEFK
jgi:OOP family OmpA-OmpF porin